MKVKWYTYILLCNDHSYYVGHTQNIQQRIATHNAGKGAKYTACRKPVLLAYLEEHTAKQDAIARELQIKKWTKAKKQALINDDTQHLHNLSKRHNP
jgi:predicted GIY-YIG superfamily endonuclease